MCKCTDFADIAAPRVPLAANLWLIKWGQSCGTSDCVGNKQPSTHLHLPCGMVASTFWLQVLLRALRDFNLGKLTADDTGIFMGLLNDLFPKTVELVPRAIDREFEPKASPTSAAHAGAVLCNHMNTQTAKPFAFVSPAQCLHTLGSVAAVLCNCPVTCIAFLVLLSPVDGARFAHKLMVDSDQGGRSGAGLPA